MLSRWFDRSKALDNKDAQVRLKFLGELTPDKAAPLQTRLAALLQTEPAADVRKALLSHIRSVDLLLPLLAASDPVARETTDYIVNHRQPTLAISQKHPEVARARLLITDSAEERTALLSLFDTPEQLVDLIMKARGDLREQLLQHPRLNTEESYGQIERLSRGHDKTLNRHARERMDAIRAFDATLTQTQERSRTIADAVRSLVRYDAPSPAARETRRRQLVLLQQELLGLMERETDTVAQAATLGAIRQSAITADSFTGLDLAPPTASPFTELLAALPAPETLLSGTTDTTAAEQALQTLQTGWQEFAGLATPSEEEQKTRAGLENRYAQLMTAVARMNAVSWPDLPDLPTEIPASGTQDFWRQLDGLDRILTRHARVERDLAWPDVLPQPLALTEARLKREQVEAARQLLRDQETTLLQEVRHTIKELGKLIDEGQSRQANGLLAETRRRTTLIAFPRSEDERAQIDALQHRVRELKDWQTFATSPKRESLLEQMRVLLTTNDEPEELAVRIKRVRADWNALGPPANRHEHDLRSEFETVADQAFEPCRKYFAEQDRLRQENLARRHELIGMLGQYFASTDWQQADFKAAESILHKAREEWHASFPVPRGDHKPLINEFEGLQQKLHDTIHQHYATNSDRKQALIDQLKSLRESAAIDAQVDAVKGMQQDWKNVGTGLRHLEQKLWRDFREVCDAVFADRSAAVDAFRASQNTLLTQANAENQALAAQIAAFTSDNVSPAVLRDASNRFAALGDLGRDGRTATDEHRRLLRQGEEMIARIAKQRKDQRLINIQQLDELLDGDSSIDSAQSDPIFAGRKPFSGAVEAELVDITVLAEICAEAETPAEDRARRMALQIELMNKRAALPAPEVLLKRWCGIDGKPDTAQVRALRTRCFVALGRLLH